MEIAHHYGNDRCKGMILLVPLIPNKFNKEAGVIDNLETLKKIGTIDYIADLIYYMAGENFLRYMTPMGPAMDRFIKDYGREKFD